MEEDFKKDHHRDIGYVRKPKPEYRDIKGFKHIWTYFKTEQGNFICSKYIKEKQNGLYMTSITNSPEGWLVHLFWGGAKCKSWFKTFNLLDEAVEHCNLYLNGKLILD